jgi:2-dehydro-3-deoxygluconokinase
MKKVFCFGELLLRLSPQSNGNWITDTHMNVYVGGAELNVATALANWDTPVKYGTVLPNNFLSADLLQMLQQKNIDTAAVLQAGERIGSYYLPQGADLKNAGVVYDRAYSAFSMLRPGMMDWDSLLADCDWFHFSAITPALNPTLAAVCKEALQVASSKGLTISLDLNYRSKLWQYGLLPTAVMPELAAYCQVIMGNVWAAETLLGIASPIAASANKTRAELVAAAGESMLQIHLQFPKVSTMAYTYRLADRYFGVLQHGATMATSIEYPLHHVVDKAGSGDCFMAGLIYGTKQQWQPAQIVAFATAAATGKLYEKGDGTHQTIEQVKSRIQ